MNNVQLNEFYCNAKIHGYILIPDKMQSLGFYDRGDYWGFYNEIAEGIDFFIDIYKDNPYNRVSIRVIDDDFGQYYDYQKILNINPTNKFALNIFNIVEDYLAKFQENGVLSGHIRGEYV